MRKLFFFTLAFFLVVGCIDRNRFASKMIKDYSDDNINLLYEACFNSKSNPPFLVRWKQDIRYFIESDSCLNNFDLVEEVVEELNALDLPITILESSKEDANCIIRFVHRDGISKEVTNCGVTELRYDIKQNASFAILKIDKDLELSHKRSTLFHEFFHLLGFGSHVTSDRSSILYPLTGKIEVDIAKDLLLIEILYNTNWPDKYLKQDFEKDFSDVLYKIRKVEKLERYALTNNINSELFQHIIKKDLMSGDSFDEETLCKIPNNSPVSFEGDFPDNFQDTLNTVLNVINRISDKIQLKYDPDIHSKGGGIRFFFEKSSKASGNEFLIDSVIVNSLNDYEISTVEFVNIYISGSFIDAIPSRFVGAILFSALCNKKNIVNFDISILEEPAGAFKLKTKYEDLIKFYYSPHLPNNITKTELEEVLATISN